MTTREFKLFMTGLLVGAACAWAGIILGFYILAGKAS